MGSILHFRKLSFKLKRVLFRKRSGVSRNVLKRDRLQFLPFVWVCERLIFSANVARWT
ncbi:uncharacterized protein [Physcomitrium patens]|uniref:uncharacterized protein isoform X2 n=1 Tax=Physcomitrium patens TaxID=3218 RepID=UPI003CCDE3CF